MAHLDTEIAYYEKHEQEFLKDHKFDWVLISGEKIFGFYRTIEEAGRALKELYEGRPILMRRIGMDVPVAQRVEFATL